MHPRIFAKSHPEKAAAIMSDSGDSLTYGELEKRANRGAQLFRSQGIENGDTIAIWITNCLEYYEIYWAAQRAGLYICPISSQLTAEEAAYILNDSASRLLITESGIRAAKELLSGSADQLPDVEHIYQIGSGLDGIDSWNISTSCFPEDPIDDEQAGFHLVYSSGTTGRPKGIRLPLTGGPATEPHMLSERLAGRYGANENSVFLSPAPLYHTAPLAYTTMLQRLGATIVVMPKFDAKGALAAIDRYKVTFAQMVPTMFIRMLNLPEETRRKYDVGSITHIVHAAAPCPVETKHLMIKWLGPIIYEYYGGSEGNGSTFITSEEWLGKPGSVGKADWGTIHICDDQGNELPANETGLVYFEGGWDFQYLNDDKKTKEARNPNHPAWSTLGDVGHLDKDGYLFLTDRKSFMIISGGVNIYPQEAENILIQHPAVEDVAVIGVPNPEMGEEVKAVVQPVNWELAGDELAESLIEYCRDRLAHVKCPKSVDFDRKLPRHDTGKLYKQAIKKRYWAMTNAQ